MPGLDLTASWQNATTGLALVDGKTYTVEFHGPTTTLVYATHVPDGDGSEPDLVDNALVHYNRDIFPAEPPFQFTARSGRTWWLKTNGGASRVVAEEV